MKCNDIFNLNKNTRTCVCGSCEGSYYEDGLHAWYKGKNAIPLFFSNPSFIKALAHRSNTSFDPKNLFTAGVVEHDCKTFKDLT